jgi:hypothetical protein
MSTIDALIGLGAWMALSLFFGWVLDRDWKRDMRKRK